MQDTPQGPTSEQRAVKKARTEESESDYQEIIQKSFPELKHSQAPTEKDPPGNTRGKQRACEPPEIKHGTQRLEDHNGLRRLITKYGG